MDLFEIAIDIAFKTRAERDAARQSREADWWKGHNAAMNNSANAEQADKLRDSEWTHQCSVLDLLISRSE